MLCHVFYLIIFLKLYHKMFSNIFWKKFSMIRTKIFPVVNINPLFLTAHLCNIKYFYVQFKVAEDMVFYMV